MNDDDHRPRHLARRRADDPEEPDEPPDGDADEHLEGGERPAHARTTRPPRDERGAGEERPPRDERRAGEERGAGEERRAGEDVTPGAPGPGAEVPAGDQGAGARQRPPAAGPAGPADQAPVGTSGRSAGTRGWRAWALPGVLAAVSVMASTSALVVERDAEATAIGAPSPGTPVLSARRAPELLAAPVANRRLRADLDAWLASSPTETCLAVEVAGDDAYRHRADVPLTGASTQKLLTATGLLLAFDPDATLATRALAGSSPSDGVIAGDLYLVGGGDPLLATAAWRDHFTRQPRTINDIDQLARRIADAGVSRIEGSVVGDGGRYDDQTFHPSWPRRFFDQDSVGPISGLIVNDGFAAFPLEGEDRGATVPAGDPAGDAARVLTDRLEAAGVEVVGSPRSGEAPDAGVEVAMLPSPPIADLVAEMLLDSDNETAEMALKELGVLATGEGSWPAGAEALTELLADADVPIEGVEVVDGSGLSIDNRLTCDTLVDVLTLPRTGALLREGLPVAGRTGTLAERWEGTRIEGRLRAKTGTLRNVTALAGEVDAADGDTLTFAYVATVADPGTVDPDGVDQVRLAEILLDYPRDLRVDALGPEAAPQAAGPEDGAPPEAPAVDPARQGAGEDAG